MSAPAHTSTPVGLRTEVGGILTAGLALFAAYHVGLGLWMAISPHTFYTAIGPFGIANSHYVRDTASFELALGAGFLLALRRPSWRVPVLAVTAIQFGLHSINHLVDIDTAHPEWVGYFDFFALFATTGQLAWLTRVAARERSGAEPGGGVR
jgi:hypothetical protein